MKVAGSQDVAVVTRSIHLAGVLLLLTGTRVQGRIGDQDLIVVLAELEERQLGNRPVGLGVVLP